MILRHTPGYPAKSEILKKGQELGTFMELQKKEKHKESL